LLGNYILLNTSDSIKSIFPDFKRKNIFIRPEYMGITEKEYSLIEGTIQSVEFLGSYYLLIIKHNDISFKISTKSTDFNYKTGDSVHLTFIKTPDWHID
jgi:ABC-type sugar transport system ATPase subunit